MVASYPDLDYETPSSWFAWGGDKHVQHTGAICHAKMRYDGYGYDNLITAVPKSDELSLEYLRMLIRGPFSSMSDLIKLERVGIHYYLHLMLLGKWPANVLMNFCIASRIPIEFHYLLSPWAVRCEKGFDPTLAFLLTSSYGAKQDNSQFRYRSFDIYRSGHMWLDPSSNWMNILNGTFQDVSKPFKTHPQDSCPTNIIWGHCKDHIKLKDMTDEEIAAFYTQPVQVFEPPPPPKYRPKINKIKPFNFAEQIQNYQQAVDAHNAGVVGINLNPAVEVAMPAHMNVIHNFDDIVFDQPNIGDWGQVVPADPQPHIAEHYIAPDFEEDDPLDEWFPEDPDD